MNRLLRVHNRQFLRRVSVGTIVFEHSPSEHVSLYRPRSEIYVQENICRFVSSVFGPCVKIKEGGQTTHTHTLYNI